MGVLLDEYARGTSASTMASQIRVMPDYRKDAVKFVKLFVEHQAAKASMLLPFMNNFNKLFSRLLTLDTDTAKELRGFMRKMNSPKQCAGDLSVEALLRQKGEASRAIKDDMAAATDVFRSDWDRLADEKQDRIAAIEADYVRIQRAIAAEYDTKVRMLDAKATETKIVYDYGILVRQNTAENDVCEIVKSLSLDDVDPYMNELTSSVDGSQEVPDYGGWDFSDCDFGSEHEDTRTPPEKRTRL